MDLEIDLELGDDVLEIRDVVDEIARVNDITYEQLECLLSSDDTKGIEYLHCKAREVADEIYGKEVFIRGLIEFTNYCKNDCLYCGIRHSNHNVSRYRLTNEQILSCCKSGYELGFRTFVLQGGEDPYYTDERICELVSKIKNCIRIVQLLYLLVKKVKRAIRNFSMQELTDIY